VCLISAARHPATQRDFQEKRSASTKYQVCHKQGVKADVQKRFLHRRLLLVHDRVRSAGQRLAAGDKT
jgi:hypothetical protein